MLTRTGLDTPWKVAFETWFGGFCVDAVGPGSDGSGDWTDDWDRSIAAFPNGTAEPGGLVRSLHYSAPAHESMYIVRTGEETLACGLIHRTVRYVAHDGLVPKQDADRENYGPPVARAT